MAVSEVHGRSEGRTETMNAAIDFMRSNGMSNKQIITFRNSILNQNTQYKGVLSPLRTTSSFIKIKKTYQRSCVRTAVKICRRLRYDVYGQFETGVDSHIDTGLFFYRHDR